ncbi:alcohol dehydrogenase [Lactiplantibacillus sp. DA1]|uniref:alcohol dehydrogenase n=1 Tax=Lactiplantibacillus sp. DA1 TaxID=3079857 RepID=UPI00292A6328|nr:alcohol dehydrogenase [Lactiplantibacillus sp. DA1]MDV0431668.1 alcohol dehydrogenase [Lactiplantibacillus sp. DA1]
MRLKDLTGETFSRLTVIERAESAPNGNARWLCQCSCGRQVVVDSYRLRKGITKSCGCLRADVSRKNIFENPQTRKNMGRSDNLPLYQGTSVDRLKPNSRNRSGVIGVSFDRCSQKWVARLMYRGRLVLNQQFADMDDAIMARKQAEQRYVMPVLEEYAKTSAD